VARMLSVYNEVMTSVVLTQRKEPDEATIVDALNNVYKALLKYGVKGPDWELRRDKHGVLRVVYGTSLPESDRKTFLVRWERVPD
jgi:hypothetical protein